jgi:hypothetical protein
MKKIFSLAILFICLTGVKGQYVTNALSFSQSFPTMTARSMAMGGAFTSLGGDFSSAYLNPAGLALYRKSEFIFSPSLQFSNLKTSYLGQKNEESRTQFAVSSLGYVGTHNSGKEKGLISTNYAIGYNRTNSFNSDIKITGTNETSSYSDFFVEMANGYTPENLHPFYERLAFDTWVIDTLGGDDNYISLVPVPIEQTNLIEIRGGSGEWSFAFGMNFNDIIYWGLGLGIESLNYNRTSLFSETNTNTAWAFSGFDFYEDLTVRGTGINAKTGIIVRVAKPVWLGVSVQIPTFYNISESFYNNMTSYYTDSIQPFFAEPIDENGFPMTGQFDYKLNTPMKVTGGLSVQLGKFGILSGDLEYISYSTMKMRSDRDYESNIVTELVSSVNTTIEQTYKSVLNLKFGSEFRIKNFSIRAGAAYFPSPYAEAEINRIADLTEITSGIGYRNENFFVDLGFSGLLHSEKYNLYTANGNSNIAGLDHNRYRYVATFGIRL